MRQPTDYTRRRQPIVVMAVCMLVAGIVGVGWALANPTAARAEPQPDPRVGEPRGIFTAVTITATGDGMAVNGALAPADFDPLTGYPAGIPPGSVDDPVAFAGTIQVVDPDGRTALVYCIELEVETQVGVHYEIGDWTEANVPNLGFVEYILTNYFPTTGEPVGAAGNAQRAAAVQAAIWFFSDNYVLAVNSPIRALTEAIVADALANGPLQEPAVPQLTVTPDSMAAPATGEIVGPFEVAADGPATITSVGVEVFTDPDGVNLLEDGDEVSPGAQLWVRSVSDVEPQGFVLERVTTLLQGTVYIYDGSNPGLEDAQKLILAQQTELAVVAGAEILPFAAGGLEVTKLIDGDGAGRQGEVLIQVDCVDPEGGLDQQHVLTVPAGTPAGEHPQLITGIPAGSTCTITEPADGDNDLVNVAQVVIDPTTVSIVEEQTAQVSVTDTYDRALGSLLVTKAITGPAAGSQGAITIQVTCDEPSGAFDQRFTIGAGAAAGTYPQPVITGIPAGTECTVAEPSTGENGDVRLDPPVVIDPATTTIVDATISQVTLANAYVGSLPHTGPAVPPLSLTTLGFGLIVAGTAACWASGRIARPAR